MALRNRHKWLTVLRLLLYPAGFVALFLSLATGEVSQRLSEADWLLGAGFFLSQTSVFFCSVRLFFVLGALGAKVSVLNVYKIHLKSIFYFLFVPLSVGSDIAKVGRLSAALHGHTIKGIIAAVLADRVIGLLTFALISAALLPGVTGLGQSGDLPTLCLIFGSAGLFSGGALVTVPLVKRYLFKEAVWGGQGWKVSPAKVAGAFSASVAMQLLMCVAVYFGGRSLGIEISLQGVCFAVSSAMLLQVVPITLMGAGATEMASVAIYLASGLSQFDSVVLTSIAYTYKLVTALIGGVSECSGILGSLKGERLGRNG